ncbi:hypothetical protein [Rhodococcus opacus]|uniref:hypothetical protein n=1 Tax=Rhodococcus opacus TaxID=37919 RepID=UPI00155A7946|nr:hypothetical protein [Rhodococcus opacus]
MIELPQIDNETLEVIARQLGIVMPVGRLNISEADNPELGESMPIWMLPRNAIYADIPLADSVPTGEWHHQIYKQNEPRLYAHSKPVGPRMNDWQVTMAGESDAALEIDHALTAAEGLKYASGEVRLLVIPALFINALWIAGDNSVFVPASVPDAFHKILVPYDELDAEAFISALRQISHIDGIKFQPGLS